MPAGFDLLPQLLGVARGLVLLAQFLLDGLHLLAQVVLALRLLHPVLHFALDLVAKLLNLQLLGQVLVDLLQADVDVGRLQHVLLVACGERRQRRGDEVDHAAGIVDIRRNRGQLIRQRRRAGNNLLEQREYVALQRFNLRVLGRDDLGNGIHRCAHERLQLGVLRDLDPLQTFGENEQALVGHAHNFVHHRQGPDGEQVRRLRRIDPRLALGHHHNGLVFAQGIDQLDRALPAYGKRQHGVRKQHRVAHGQQRQRSGFRGVVPQLGIVYL